MRPSATTEIRATLEAWILSQFEGLDQQVLLMFARGERARDAIRLIEAHERARQGRCSTEQAQSTFHRIVSEAAPRMGEWLESWDPEADDPEGDSPAQSCGPESDLTEYPPVSAGVIDPESEIATREANASDPISALVREAVARAEERPLNPDGS